MKIEILNEMVSVESLGLIPIFFDRSANREGIDIQTVADNMDELYNFGGFRFPFTGKIEDDGSYIADNDEDPPLAPMAKLEKYGLVCWIYPYAIVGLVDSDGNQKIGRFD